MNAVENAKLSEEVVREAAGSGSASLDRGASQTVDQLKKEAVLGFERGQGISLRSPDKGFIETAILTDC